MACPALADTIQLLVGVGLSAIGTLERHGDFTGIAGLTQVEPAGVGMALEYRQPPAIEASIGHAHRSFAAAQLDLLRPSRIEGLVAIPGPAGLGGSRFHCIPHAAKARCR